MEFISPAAMISTGQLVKETVLFGTINVGLPTIDVCTDGVQIFNFYKGYAYHPSCFFMDENNVTIVNQTCLDEIPQDQLEYENHPFWATLLLVPFLLNYLAGWYKWYQEDKKGHFSSWLACLVGLYPSLRAAIIIRELWRNPKRGLAKKRKFEREMSEAEVFLEAIPTSGVLSYIMNSVFESEHNRRGGSMIVFNSSFGFFWFFWLTYATSIFSATLGMAKALKVRLSQNC